MQASENKEAAIVAAETITFAAATYIATLPISLEIKLPIVALIGSVGAAIFAYWKAKVNTEKEKGASSPYVPLK